jgi:hypothetical protein
MDEATQRLWAERAVQAVNCAFPFVEFSTWAGCERLLPQAHACAELINQWGFESRESRLLNRAGFYLYERGRYAGAKPLLERALAIREKALGAAHPHVATWASKTTRSVCEPSTVLRKPSRCKLVRGPFGLRAPD